MNSWYFTFEFPPDFGGGLSSYMRIIADTQAQRGTGSMVIFTLTNDQSGLIATRQLARNVTLVSLKPSATTEQGSLGHWVNISRLFERSIDLLMFQMDAGLLPLPMPDYIEFADGFGIGMVTIQQKLCLNSRLADVPIIVNAHTPTYLIDRMNQLPVYQLPRYWTSRMELQALSGADLVIGPSQAILDLVGTELAKSGAAPPRTDVLHNPFPVPLRPKAPVAAVTRDHFYMASRLTHWKGVEGAIRALQRIWAAGHQIPFLIFGEDTHFTVSGGSYCSYIRSKFPAEVASGLIRFMGKQSREAICASAQTAFAQLHPSHFDNFPYSVIEALAEGTLCVAGTNGGIGEITTSGKDIFLTEVRDPDTFAATLLEVMALSEEQRASMTEQAQVTVRAACDPDRYLARKEDIVRSLARTRARSRPGQRKPRTALFPFTSPADPGCHIAARLPEVGPVLSVVVPYFNMGRFIDDTLHSIRRSSRDRLEIIIVNDGSTDAASVARLDRLHADHGLSGCDLRIITTPNRGVANARNTGVKMATAPFVTLLDADDLVAPRYYDTALRILTAYKNVSFVGAWIEDFDRKGRIRNWATWNAEPPLQLIMNQTNCQSLVYKREAYLRDGWHDPELRMFLDDWEGVIALLAGGHRGVMIPEPLFRYRIRPGSIFRSSHNLWDLNYEKITTKHEALFNRWGADVAAFMNANGPNNFYHVAGKHSALRK